jgi:hypothetical protein
LYEFEIPFVGESESNSSIGLSFRKESAVIDIRIYRNIDNNDQSFAGLPNYPKENVFLIRLYSFAPFNRRPTCLALNVRKIDNLFLERDIAEVM